MLPTDAYASAIFWATVASVCVALLGVLLNFLFRVPQRRKKLVVFGDDGSTPLLPEGLGQGLIITNDGDAIEDPRVILFKLLNVGRSDISSIDFDQNRPIQVDLGTRLLRVLSVKTTPPDAVFPSTEIRDNSLELAPSLIKRNQESRFGLLVDGVPSITVTSPLIETATLTLVDWNKRRRAFSWIRRGGVLVAIIGLYVFFLIHTLPSNAFFYGWIGNLTAAVGDQNGVEVVAAPNQTVHLYFTGSPIADNTEITGITVKVSPSSVANYVCGSAKIVIGDRQPVPVTAGTKKCPGSAIITPAGYSIGATIRHASETNQLSNSIKLIWSETVSANARNHTSSLVKAFINSTGSPPRSQGEDLITITVSSESSTA